MEEISLQMNLWTTATAMALKGNYPLKGHLNIMELLKEGTRQYRKWLEQC
jgi:hypothetical protein